MSLSSLILALTLLATSALAENHQPPPKKPAASAKGSPHAADSDADTAKMNAATDLESAEMAPPQKVVSPLSPLPPRSPEELMKLEPSGVQEDSSRAEGSAGKPIPISLPEAVKRALDQSTLVLKSQYDVYGSGEQLLQAYAQFLPNLDVAGTYAFQKGTSYLTTAAPTTVYSRNLGVGYQVSSTLNLFSGFTDIGNLKSSHYKRKASQLSLERARQQITLDVTQAYLQVILDEDVVRIAEKSLTLSQQREVLLDEQTKVGVKNKADLFRQQAQTSSDETYLLNARTKARNDLLALAARLRLDCQRDYSLQRPNPIPPVMNKKYENEGDLVKVALSHRPDLGAYQATSLSAEWAVTRARGAYYPRLDLGFNYLGAGHSLYSQDVNGVNQVPALQAPLRDQLDRYHYYSLGLTLSWGIFDRFLTRLDSARAHVAAGNARTDADDRHLQVISETRQAWGEYRASLSQLESSRRGLEAAQKAYEVEAGRYEVGSVSFIDLIVSQSALISAEAARAQALINFQIQGDQVEFSLGTL
jgi:outer membrane protein